MIEGTRPLLSSDRKGWQSGVSVAVEDAGLDPKVTSYSLPLIDLPAPPVSSRPPAGTDAARALITREDAARWRIEREAACVRY
jgi:hypothetical protein